jgi:hypothetical protein
VPFWVAMARVARMPEITYLFIIYLTFILPIFSSRFSKSLEQSFSFSILLRRVTILP